MILASVTASTRPPDSCAMIRATARSTTAIAAAGRWRKSSCPRRAHDDLGPARLADDPGVGHAVDQVEGVGERVGRRGDTGAARERDLAQTEVEHAGGALAAQLARARPSRESGRPSGGQPTARAPAGRAPRPARRTRTASDDASSRPAASRSRRSSSMAITLDPTTDTRPSRKGDRPRSCVRGTATR